MDNKNSLKLNIVLSFLFGLFMATDVIYLFNIGSSYFTISEVYSTALLFFLLFTNRIDFKNKTYDCGKSFRVMLLYILFSSVMAFATFTSTSLMYRYFVGIISLAISLTAMINMMTLFEYRSFVINGLEAGIILNFVFSMIEYYSWNAMGVPFTTLYDIFPQPSFHMNEYNFSAEGLFLEPSHMIHFIAAVFPIWICCKFSFSVKSILFLVATLFPVSLSGAGTSMAVWGSLAIIIVTKMKDVRMARLSTVAKMIILTTFLIILLLYFADSTIMRNVRETLDNYLTQAFEGSNVRDSSNTERYMSMSTAAALIPQYPLGCGWNMVHTLLEESTNLPVATAFNDIIEMTLELGIGILLYIWFIFNTIRLLLKIKTDEAMGVAIALIAIFTMQCLADNAFNPCMMMIFGFARCVIIKNGESSNDNETVHN